MTATPHYGAATRIYSAVCAAVAWLSLAAQLFLFIAWPVTLTTIGIGLLNFFRFFTVLTNILMAIEFTAFACRGADSTPGFLTRPAFATAVATYAVILTVIYATLLRGAWHPTGLTWVIDELLHDVLPVGYVLLWCMAVHKGRLRWRDALPWLIYPTGFAVYNGIFSAVSGVDPYPFLDTTTLGFPRVLVNTALLALAFLILGLVFIAVDKAITRRRRRAVELSI